MCPVSVSPSARFQRSSESRNAFSVGPHLAHSGPLAPWPKSLSISKYFASTPAFASLSITSGVDRSEEHTSELQSRPHIVCRLLLEKKMIEGTDLTDQYVCVT